MTTDRTPVLVAGGGSVGLATALFLARRDVPVVLVEGRDGPSIHPRATGIGPRSVEFLRAAGVADAVDARAVDMTGGARKVTATTLAAGLQEAPVPAAARGGQAVVDPFGGVAPYALRGTCAQDRLDAVVAAAAAEAGADLRWSTRLVSFVQDDQGVIAVLDDPGGRYELRADRLVASDGARSSVREALGIGTTGPGELGTPMVNILFRADLRPYTHGRTFVTCTITTPDAPGMFVTVDGAHEWVFHTEYDPEAGEAAADFTPERCRELVAAAVGDPALEIEVRSVLPWRVRGRLADRFAAGRVFLAGDAAHTVPPLGAFGLNTGLADAYDLAWKLAAVHHGWAAPALLDSYEAERRPVAVTTLDQAVRRLADPALHWASGPAADAVREAAGVLAPAVVHLGYRYESAAVVTDGPRPAPRPGTRAADVLDGTPGTRVPHVSLDRDGAPTSTLDLHGPGFTVLAGPSGHAWVATAAAAADRLGVPVGAYRVGPDTNPADPAGRWPAAAGIAADGALLVRPDGIVGRRFVTAPPDPAGALAEVLARILARAAVPVPA